jgi:hypothetical protein
MEKSNLAKRSVFGLNDNWRITPHMTFVWWHAVNTYAYSNVVRVELNSETSNASEP